jgi:PknH-like extracellular domain
VGAPLRPTRSGRTVARWEILSTLRNQPRLGGHWRWLVPVLAACLVLGGIGWAVWPSQPATVPLHLVAGTVQADLLTPDQASRIAEVTVVPELGASQPPPPISVTPAKCVAAAGPATQAVYGRSWTAFLSATDEDSSGSGDYTVSQVVGVFPDSGQASAAFKRLTSGLAQCSSATTKDKTGQTTKWSYKSYPATPVAVAWTATQNGGLDWACYHQVQLQGAAFVQVSVCEYGNGAGTASALTEALAGKVSR